MRYKVFILVGFFFLLVFAVGFFLYPEHLLIQEELDWYVLTPDYISLQFGMLGGMSSFIANFLLQFYKTPILGSLIQASSLALMFGLFFLFSKRIGVPNLIVGLSCIPSLVFWYEFKVWFLPAVLQFDMFLLGLLVYTYIRRTVVRYVLAAVMLPFLCMWMYGAVLIIFYFSILAIEFFVLKKRRASLYIAVMVGFSILSPILWNRFIAYVPNDLLYCFVDKDYIFSSYGLYCILFFVPLLFVFLSLLKFRGIFSGKFRNITIIAFPLLAMVAFAFLIMFSLNNRTNEKFLRVQRDAKAGQWQNLLREIDADDAEDANFKPYIALALSASGQLADKLFSYSFRSPSEFVFPAQEMPLSSADFNSLFYYNLNIKNEAIHQAFQANIFSKEGASFGFMRRLIDLQIEQKNIFLAKKYLDILNKSSFNKTWVRSRIRELGKISASEKLPAAEQDYIIDNTSVMIPLANIADADSTNIKAVDYLLCGMLLDKDLKSFYNYFQKYYSKEKTISVHFQEALLLVDLMIPGTQAAKQYTVSVQCRDAFEEFGRLMAQRPSSDKEMKLKYGNTYWYYGFVKNAR